MSEISEAYDALARRGAGLARPASREEMARPLATVDPLGWLGPDIRGRHVLCLAAGGGRQGPLYAAAGAVVTVVDISPGMLSLDREMARQYRLDLRLIEASMDRLPMLADRSFDLVIHPVSTCYVQNVQPVFEEVARVIRSDGLYVSQHKQPVSLQSSIEPKRGGYVVQHAYYRRDPVPPPAERTPAAARLREARATEYLHRWEELVGGICRAGFVVEDLVEPVHCRDDAALGSFAHRASYIAPYVRICARRRRTAAASLVWK